jgi:hypothetical protein
LPPRKRFGLSPLKPAYARARQEPFPATLLPSLGGRGQRGGGNNGEGFPGLAESFWKGIEILVWCTLPVCCFLINPVQAYTPEDCVRCHRQGSSESSLQMDLETFKGSVHGETLSCLDCHGPIQDESHEKMTSSRAVSCVECHEQENRHGLRGGEDRRPKCYSCHTKHGILGKGDSLSSVHPEGLPGTCAACHPVESGKPDYLSWFPSLQIVSHGKQDFGKAYERSNCLGCHQGEGAHGENKPINDQDCAKCHNDLMGFMHPKADSEKQPGILASVWIYQMFLAGLLWGGFRFYTRRKRDEKGGAGC